jgi:hypothetical protein
MQTRMIDASLLIGAVVCGFFIRLGESRSLAVPIPNCPSCNCKEVYASWGTAPGGTKCYSYQRVGATYPFVQGDNTTRALTIYSPACVGKLPFIAAGTLDRWIWPNNSASCQNDDGTFPSPQEVQVAGTPPVKDGNIARRICSY